MESSHFPLLSSSENIAVIKICNEHFWVLYMDIIMGRFDKV